VLLKLGGTVEVLEPLALRYSIKDYAEQILGVYV
jgi:predicted DNA-binding transcriptional regulator YafY